MLHNEQTPIPEPATLNETEIAIPSEVEEDLYQGLERVLPHLSEHGNERADLVITLERSGTLAYTAVESALEAAGEKPLSRINILLGRDDSADFERRYPNTIVSPDFLYDSTDMVIKDREEKYRENIGAFIEFVKTSNNLQDVALEIETQPKANSNIRKIAIVDDTKQFGDTLEILTPVVVGLALRNLGRTASFHTESTVRTRHLEIIEDLLRTAEANKTMVNVQLLTLFENNDWLHNIAEANFSYAFGDPADKPLYDIARTTLANVMKGSMRTKDMNNTKRIDTTTIVELVDSYISRMQNTSNMSHKNITREQVLAQFSEYFSPEELTNLNGILRISLRKAGKDFAQK